MTAPDLLQADTRPCPSAEALGGTLLTAVGFAAFLAIIGPQLVRDFHSTGQPLFWDAHVYERAIHAWQRGANPYTHDQAMNFVYPPVFLFCADALSRLVNGALAWKLYVLANLTSLLAFPVVLSRGYLQSRWFTAAFALASFVFQPLLTSTYAFASGNIANIFYSLILLAGLPGIRSNQWLLFYAAVVSAASVKPPMLLLLLLPLFLGEKQGRRCVAATLLVCGVHILQLMLNPATYAAYRHAVQYQLAGRSDVGVGIFSVTFHAARLWPGVAGVMALLVHSLLYGSLAAGLYWGRRLGAHRDLRDSFICLTITLALLSNPRMLGYDLDLLAVPAAFVLGELLRASSGHVRFPVFLLAPLLVSLPFGRFALTASYMVSLLCFPMAWYQWRRLQPSVQRCHGSRVSAKQLIAAES